MIGIFAKKEDAISVLNSDSHGREAVNIVEELHNSSSQLPAGFQGFHEPDTDDAYAVIVLEGLDGSGKSTLARNLHSAYERRDGKAFLLKTPPPELSHLRGYFDEQSVEMRRAFYFLSNYGCAVQICACARHGVVVVDRFWPSTVAYTLGLNAVEIVPKDAQKNMPQDLLDLLPGRSAMVWLVLEVAPEVRCLRVRNRAGDGPAVTAEEQALEDSRCGHRVMDAYKALSLGGEKLTLWDASGTEAALTESVLRLVDTRVKEKSRLTPLSVNWHYTRECNYSCQFCFHTNTSSFFLPQDHDGMRESKRCLQRLKDAGMKKMNFSGGEPFLHPRELGELCRFCKKDLRLESVSIVSNGSKIQESWLKRFGGFVDILAISCDSFDEGTNKLIGRGTGMHLTKLMKVKSWCITHGVSFKLNSGICKHNVQEDMSACVVALSPIRWKVFQVLLLEGENIGHGAKLDASALAISDAEFQAFLERHRSVKCMVPEDNATMKDSYLILDEELRFLNCTQGGKEPSRSLCDVTVDCALQEAGFDSSMFVKRGGIYDWSQKSLPPIDMEDVAGRLGGSIQAERKKPNKSGRTDNHLNLCQFTCLVAGISVLGCVLFRR